MQRENQGCLLAILSALGILPPRSADDEGDNIPVAELAELPYRIRDDFLSPAERSFHSSLVLAIGDRVVVCPKVRLGDILFTTELRQGWKYSNRINQKHIDFLLCHPDTMRPLLAIELDDSSHQREDSQERDRFKDAAFAAAGLPLIRITTRRNYVPQQILAELLPHLGGPSAAGAIPYASPLDAGPPTCPKCGVPMAIKTATRGKSAGQKFYGCPNFPKCREIVSGRG